MSAANSLCASPGAASWRDVYTAATGPMGQSGVTGGLAIAAKTVS